MRDLDLVLWGASGFTGALVAEYLMERYGAGGELRWALGGRSEKKLAALRERLGAGATELPIVTGEAHDREALAAMARRASVVCTTVGPYARHGSELVAACAAEGTHYCDLTGEVPWMRRMIDAHEPRARESGARIVHSCGFDSIPSDLGTFFLQRAMRERHGTPASHVKCRVRRFSGGFSGGTAASLLGVMQEAGSDPAVRRLLADPYALNPEGERFGPDGPDLSGVAWDPDLRAWTAPFVMASINTRNVRRGNAVLGYPYGRDFRYDEATQTGAGPAGWARAAGLAAGLGAFAGAAAFGPTRGLVARLLPDPGEGPSAEEREKGFFEIDLVAKHPEDEARDLRAEVTGDRDPGYGSTAKMLGESAVCLAKDALEVGGGFWTPASAMGGALLERLRQRAGLTFALRG